MGFWLQAHVRGGQMLEKTIEKKLKTEIEKRGGLCLKFTSPSTRGVPDRIILLPSGEVHFVELKAENGKLSKLQGMQFKEFLKRRAKIFLLRGLDEVKTYLEFVDRMLEGW